MITRGPCDPFWFVVFETSGARNILEKMIFLRHTLPYLDSLTPSSQTRNLAPTARAGFRNLRVEEEHFRKRHEVTHAEFQSQTASHAESCSPPSRPWIRGRHLSCFVNHTGHNCAFARFLVLTHLPKSGCLAAERYRRGCNQTAGEFAFLFN